MNRSSVTDQDLVEIQRRDQLESTTFGSGLRRLFLVVISLLLPVVRNLQMMLACAYRLAIFRLPDYYAAQAAAAASNPLLQEALVSLLMEHWKMFNIISGILLPIVIGMIQFQNAAIRTDVQTAGFVCLAYAFISFVTSSILLITVGASSRVRSQVQDDPLNGGSDLERQQTATADTNGRHHLWETFFDTARPVGTGWNINVLVALPAIWTAWSVIAFIGFLLLFAWNLGTSTMMPINEAMIPGIAATIILLVGGFYLALAISALRAPRLSSER